MLIYYIQNEINGKTYVGQSIHESNRRLNQHENALKRESHHNDYLQNSWDKYDEDDFKFGVLEIGIETLEELNKAEKFWIQVLKSMYYQWGYNIQSGGSNYKVSDETKNKLSLNARKRYKDPENHPMFGKTHSSRTKKLMSRTKTGSNIGKLNPFYGKSHSEQTKKKISESKRDKFRGVIHIKSGKEFESLTQCAEYFDTTRSAIWYQCNKAKSKKFKYIEAK